MDSIHIAQLNQRFGVPGQVAVREGPGGLPVVDVSNRHGTLAVSLYGGHVLSYRPAGHEPVLFVSESSAYTPGKPIRGGIPLCWPWFGAHPGDATMPMHGFARLLHWTLDGVDLAEDGTDVRLSLRDGEQTRTFWPHDFELALRVGLRDELRVDLTTRNTDQRPFVLTQALHTYFGVGDIGGVAIEGLENASFFDSLTRSPMPAEGAPIRIRSEVDRVYGGTTSDCLIRDAALGRQIRVAKQGSRSTVVWNPWIEKSKRMPDFGDNEYTRMLCIESTNARDDSVVLAPNETHTLTQRIRVIGG